MRWEGNKLKVEFHEWAWSQRTSGYPVYALTENGLIKIGETKKAYAEYTIPEGTKAVVRIYRSNRGYLTVYIYTRDGNSIVVDEKENFRGLEQLEQQVREAVETIIQQHIDL